MLVMIEAYLATGDRQYLDYANLRFNTGIKSYLYQGHVNTIPNLNPRLYDTNQFNSFEYTTPRFFNFEGRGSDRLLFFGSQHDYLFVMPWQHATLIYSYVAAYKYTKNYDYIKVLEDTIIPLIEYCWVTNYQSPVFGFVANGLRYYAPWMAKLLNTNDPFVQVPVNFFDNSDSFNRGIPFGDSPIGGSHTFFASLFLLADVTQSAYARSVCLNRGRMIKNGGDFFGGPTPGTAQEYFAKSDRWLIWIPERYWTL